MLLGNVENFSSLMNEKSKELNLSSTHFVTPHGLDDDNHYTSALDLAILTDYALNNNLFRKIVNTKTYTIVINKTPKTINNTNELLGYYDGVYGVKTGFTNGANRCLVTACNKNNLDVICIVLGCDTKKDRTKDTISLLNYIFENYTIINVKEIICNNFNSWLSTHKNSFHINKGQSQILDLAINENDFPFSILAIKKSDINKVSVNIIFNSYFESPLNRNNTIGESTLTIDNKKYFSVKIINNNIIGRKTYFNYILYFFRNYISFF